ncbi:MAG: CoA-transferase [Candidatus Rokubacteria bacterium]|nr:CoA-transferase [Candidatus Rokubacteria bacterium]
MAVGPGDFVEARRRLEAKPQKVGEKLTSLEEAAGLVKDGDHVAIGGCFFSRTPLALLREVLRRGPKGLTLSRNPTCFEGEWFMTAGASDTVVTSWIGIGHPWGLSRPVRELVEGDRVRVEVR